MTLSPIGNDTDPSARVLALPFNAMAVTLTDLAPFTAGMPAAACRIATRNLVVGATVCSAPMFLDRIAKVASDTRDDVMLVRTGLLPERIDPVTADVAIVGGDVLVVTALSFYRHTDRSLWLVPHATGPFVRLCHTGLCLEVDPPFASADERSDGLCAAAAEIARIAARRSAC